MDRMKAVREIEGTDNEMSSGFIVSCFIPSHFFFFFSFFHLFLILNILDFFFMQLIKEEKVQRTRDLRTIQVYRYFILFHSI